MTRSGPRMPRLARSLSARLLVLTIFFVMLAEVLIFAPSIGRYRLTWLEDRISDAHLATLALEAAPANAISEELERELLRHVQGYGVILQRPGSKALMLSADMPPKIDATYDLRSQTFVGLIGDAFAALARTENRVVRVMGPSPADPEVLVSVVLDEAPLRRGMYGYGQRILLLSVVISLITASLVYLSLQWLLVAPMRRITSAMVAFRERPEDLVATVEPGGRSDEIGVAERELATMQTGLRAALRQKEHLAALGEAVAKINHDLRNVLATAQLVSDRLSRSGDPEVQRAVPTLMRVIDRAVNMCSQTLTFTDERADLAREPVALKPMLEEAAGAVPALADADGARLEVELPDDAEVVGDRDQLFRVFVNLIKNGAEAGARRVTVRRAGDGAGPTVIEVADDGPGISEQAVKTLFKPFGASGRSGGTGLGLAIARDVMRAHGGDIELGATGPDGTVFRLTFPPRLGGARSGGMSGPDRHSGGAIR